MEWKRGGRADVYMNDAIRTDDRTDSGFVLAGGQSGKAQGNADLPFLFRRCCIQK